MKLRAVRQLYFAGISDAYDAIVTASGYESRARYLASELLKRHTPIARRYAFGFKEHKQQCARPENDRWFDELEYKSLECSGRSTQDARRSFESVLLPLEALNLPRLLIDISCMTRAWYGEIVHILLTWSKHREMHVDFAYTPAEFTPALGEYPPNQVASPVPGFVGMALPDKPTALGIGLGYHRDRAIGLKDYLDPKLTLLFYANPSFDSRYVDAVRATNDQILSEVPQDNIIAYPILDCAATFAILESLCDGLMRNSRVVLCSLGPKMFGLCCFLVAARRRDISIWRVGAGHHETPIDHKPTGVPLVMRTVWGQ